MAEEVGIYFLIRHSRGINILCNSRDVVGNYGSAVKKLMCASVEIFRVLVLCTHKECIDIDQVKEVCELMAVF